MRRCPIPRLPNAKPLLSHICHAPSSNHIHLLLGTMSPPLEMSLQPVPPGDVTLACPLIITSSTQLLAASYLQMQLHGQ